MNPTPQQTPKPLYDLPAVIEALRYIMQPGQVTELRVLEATTARGGYPGTYFGYFDDPVKLAAAVKLMRMAKGFYYVPNPVNPPLLSRVCNRIRKASKKEESGPTKDTDIIARWWLLIDADSIKPEGVSASDAEHEAALQRAREVYIYLRNLGWPQAIAGDSANGGHLNFRIEEPADDNGLIQRCLEALAKRFTDAAVKVDTVVHNPARIWKLPGTLACKGDDTPERPHRMARILFKPEQLEVVPHELLEALAAEVATPEPAEGAALGSDKVGPLKLTKTSNAEHAGNGRTFDLEDFIRRNNLDVEDAEDWTGRQGRGKRWLFKKSPMCSHDGDGPHLLLHASGAISAGCSHHSCTWTWQDLRQKLEPVGSRNGKATKPTTTTPAAAEPAKLEYVPFPVEALPSPISDFIDAGSSALGCDASYIALPTLAALAAAVGNSRRVQLKRSWCEPCVVWTVTVGRSGTLKSPAWELGIRPVQRMQDAAFRLYAQQRADYEADRTDYEQQLADWKKLGAGKRGARPVEPEEPHAARYVAQDCTVEALALLLEGTPRGLLLARDELSGWLASFDAYKGVRGADVAHWLSMHGARPMTVDRKTGRAVIHIPRAAVSIAGSVQPAILKLALGGRVEGEEGNHEHFANGLAARLLMAYPPPRPKRWTDADMSFSVLTRIEALFERLYDLQMVADEHGSKPADLPLSPDARRRFIEFYNEHAVEAEALSDDLAAAWSKLEGYAARFALLVQLVADEASGVTTTVVDIAAVEAGITLSRWFADEAARIYQDIGGGADTEESRAARERNRLVEWIRGRGGEVTPRELAASGPRKFRGTVDAAEATLLALDSAGLGSIFVPSHEGRGRPKGFVFVLREVETVETETKITETREKTNFVSVSSVSSSPEVETEAAGVGADGAPWESDDVGEI